MTGYGESSFIVCGIRFSYRFKSLNSKYLEINFYFPTEFKWLENIFEKHVREKIYRGTIDLYLEVESSIPKEPIINENILKEYQNLFNNFYDKKKVTIPIEVLASLPGCLELRVKKLDEYKSKFEYYFMRAIVKLDTTRQREGKKLLQFIIRRFKFLRRLNHKISIIHANDLSIQETLLKKKVLKMFLEDSDQVGLHIKYQEKLTNKMWIESKEDLLKMVSSDITEEVDRLKIHFSEIESFILKEDHVGRKIEFYLQEISREVNTITSKSSVVDIKQLCIQMKIELEKIKEQVRNIE